ncbi:MAG: hypothetical protein ABL901_10170 [Hyphomicrobiaceae bacterium]
MRKHQVSPGVRLFSFLVTEYQWRYIRRHFFKLSADTGREFADLMTEAVDDLTLKYSQQPEPRQMAERRVLS